jgi:hypothetical protein
LGFTELEDRTLSTEKTASTTSVQSLVLTPGPWKVASQNGTVEDEGLVGVVGQKMVNSKGKEFTLYVAQYVEEKNASLVASAPELLEACWETIQYLETRADDESNQLWGKVSATYRKACGIED